MEPLELADRGTASRREGYEPSPVTVDPGLRSDRRWHQRGKLLRPIRRLDRVVFHDLAIGETVVRQASNIDLLPSGEGDLRGIASDHRIPSATRFTMLKRIEEMTAPIAGNIALKGELTSSVVPGSATSSRSS
jgi:hypothetical protein